MLGTVGRSVEVVISAYILVQTEVGAAVDVARAVGGIDGVDHSEDVPGPYDVIVRARADSIHELGLLVVARIQNVPGITRTCPVVDF